MSTADAPSGAEVERTPPTPPGAVPVYNVPAPGDEREARVSQITVYGHSNLLYWWPVWLVSFILAGWTYFDGFQMAVIPPDSRVVKGATIDGFDQPRDVLVAPAERGFNLASVETQDAVGNPEANTKGVLAPASMTVARTNSLGVIFVATLFLVALVSTLTLRGMVSLFVIALLIAAVVTFALLDWWDDILAFFGGLDIRMNAAGYLFVAVPLFLAWLFVVFIYDQQIYMIVDEGQIRYVLDIGDSAMVVPAEGAVVEKKRNDVFRHWLLGFGTGDIVVRTQGRERIELANVINANRKLVIVNDMLRHKAIVVSEGAS
jgi:hypothetical protein